MKLTEQHIRYIVKDEVSKFLSEQGTPAALKGKIKTLGHKAQKDPHVKSAIEDSVKNILRNNSIKNDLEKIAENPVGAATFITQLMAQLNLDPASYVQIVSQLSESKRNHVNVVLNNCYKVIKEEKCRKKVEQAFK